MNWPWKSFCCVESSWGRSWRAVESRMDSFVSDGWLLNDFALCKVNADDSISEFGYA